MRPSTVTRRTLLAGLSAAGLTACARDYSRLPKADQVYVLKAERRLLLIRDRQPIREFPIQLGFAPQGHKVQEGDGRTPEGLYWVDRKNPNSSFHLSLGINYPNETDIARAEALGVDPGGDIFIHGEANKPFDKNDPDWTAGCIAVLNRQVEEIYARVLVGTPVTITA
ncbi:L,D-transpeptidase family protein [Oceanibium sediminis]|uniref:L,D-transpeptidase family protein n=1 Tax=Oceanibium sediminis TaxID=2026339 RepID=UPI000DD4B27E|nr:L,D-transpeptidase family protein [Oceanibium sediminis]